MIESRQQSNKLLNTTHEEVDPDDPDTSHIHQKEATKTVEKCTVGHKEITKQTVALTSTKAVVVGKGDTPSSDILRKVMEEQMFTLNMSRNLMSKLSPKKLVAPSEKTNDIFDLILQKKENVENSGGKQDDDVNTPIVSEYPDDYVSPLLKSYKVVEDKDSSKMKSMAADILTQWNLPRQNICRESERKRKESDEKSPANTNKRVKVTPQDKEKSVAKQPEKKAGKVKKDVKKDATEKKNVTAKKNQKKAAPPKKEVKKAAQTKKVTKKVLKVKINKKKTKELANVSPDKIHGTRGMSASPVKKATSPVKKDAGDKIHETRISTSPLKKDTEDKTKVPPKAKKEPAKDKAKKLKEVVTSKYNLKKAEKKETVKGKGDNKSRKITEFMMKRSSSVAVKSRTQSSVKKTSGVKLIKKSPGNKAAVVGPAKSRSVARRVRFDSPEDSTSKPDERDSSPAPMSPDGQAEPDFPSLSSKSPAVKTKSKPNKSKAKSKITETPVKVKSIESPSQAKPVESPTTRSKSPMKSNNKNEEHPKKILSVKKPEVKGKPAKSKPVKEITKRVSKKGKVEKVQTKKSTEAKVPLKKTKALKILKVKIGLKKPSPKEKISPKAQSPKKTTVKKDKEVTAAGKTNNKLEKSETKKAVRPKKAELDTDKTNTTTNDSAPQETVESSSTSPKKAGRPKKNVEKVKDSTPERDSPAAPSTPTAAAKYKKAGNKAARQSLLSYDKKKKRLGAMSPGENSLRLLVETLEKNAIDAKSARRQLIANEGFSNTTEPERSSNRGALSRNYKDIILRRYSNFMHITLNPATTLICNSIGYQTLNELSSAMGEIEKEAEIAVVLLSSTGNTFCSGIDISELLHNTNDKRNNAAEKMAKALREFLHCLLSSQKLLVAGVNGSAVGLGVSMLPCFDMVYASDKATFQTPYAHLGQVPEGGATASFPHLMGIARSSEMLLGCQQLSATEALQHGLISQVLWPDTFMEQLIPQVSYIANISPQCVCATKALLRHNTKSRLQLAIDSECRLLQQQWPSDECQRRIEEYLDNLNLPLNKYKLT